MDDVYLLLGFLLAAITATLTLLMLITFRRERRISVLSSLLSTLLSLVMLPIFVAVSGARLNPVIGVPALIFGLLLGFLRGQTMRLYFKGNHVMGRHSLLFLFFWGGSLILTQLFSLFESNLWAAAGLIPLYLTTGTQVGMYGNILLRRIAMQPPRGPMQLPKYRR